jgi:cation diffusion facilitator family transporter
MTTSEQSDRAIHAREDREKLIAALLSVGVNVMLIAVEGTVAWFTGSLAVLADVGHSAFDLLASITAVWGVRMASAPPDRGHPYGHGRYENVSSLIQVTMLGLIAVFIVAEVGVRLATGLDISVSNAALAIVVATLAVDYLTARYLASVARRHHSFALEADSYHFTTDFWAKIAVIIGLTAARAGQEWVDPAAALVVAGFMLYTGWRLGVQSTRVLLDAAPEGSVANRVRGVLMAEVGEHGFHSLRMRQAGKWVLVDLCVHMPPEMTLADAHHRAHHLASRLQQEVEEVREAIVHLEPAGHHPEPGEEGHGG